MHYAAILGFGTVGSGVAEALGINTGRLTAKGEGITLKYIVDVRDFPDSPFAGLLTKDFAVVEADPEVDFVVETIGGIGIAFEFTKRALTAGKSVVTSNKELVATHGSELMALARERGVSYLFEASVGGGVPMLRTVANNLGSENIKEFFGILNGTTNYILTQMFKNGVAFGDALKQAQAMGYSEANPTADIEGHDACRKVAILSSLISGKQIKPEWIATRGITGVTLEDVVNAEKLSCTIKLLGRAVFGKDGSIRAYVAPHLIPGSILLSHVEDVMNGLFIRGESVGDVMLYGAGAGKLPTASAIVSDLYVLAKDKLDGEQFAWGDPEEGSCSDAGELASAWYVRMCPSNGWAREQTGLELIAEAEGSLSYRTAEMNQADMEAAFAGQTVLSAFRIIK